MKGQQPTGTADDPSGMRVISWDPRIFHYRWVGTYTYTWVGDAHHTAGRHPYTHSLPNQPTNEVCASLSVLCRRFLSEEECDYLVKIATPRLQASGKSGSWCLVSATAAECMTSPAGVAARSRHSATTGPCSCQSRNLLPETCCCCHCFLSCACRRV